MCEKQRRIHIYVCMYIHATKLNLSEHIELVNICFEKPTKIDILIRAVHLYDILDADKHKILQLIFQKTVFSFIVFGTFKSKCNLNFCGLC